ncbi:MAG: cupin domain-containing protein [Sphingobium sp.]
MARVRVHEATSLNWLSVMDVAAPDLLPRLGEAEKASHVAFHEQGDAQSLQLFEIAYEPGADIEVHAHHEDEIIYILGGSMKLGNRTVGPGSSLFVQGGTLYSFMAGPDGLKMLNFRARRDDSFITRDAFRTEYARTGRA